MKRRNGIPAIGFGTYPLKGEDAYNAVRIAIDLGYRHIDTAQMYMNEADVGRAIRQSGVPRSEFYIVSKVDPANLDAAHFSEAVNKTLEKLDGPVDLLLIHWPPLPREIDGTVDRLMAEHQARHTANIGVSNFTPNMLRRAHARTKGAIICNQIEFHPLLDQSNLRATANELGIVITAFSPIARGAALEPPAILNIAARHNRPPSQIVLRWIIQQGVVPIPMTTKAENAKSNLQALEFELSETEMAEISALGRKNARTVNPSWMAHRWDE
jgi:2,5-diketo-D-gluconate reductase B